MTINPLVYWAAAVVCGISLFCYLTAFAVEWFLDSEHRAIQQWLDNHKKQLEDEK